MSDKDKKKYMFIPFIPIPFITDLDEILIDYLPEEYKGAAEHYLNAKIELLKSVNELINKRIERLEARKKEFKVKREKVDVE